MFDCIEAWRRRHERRTLAVGKSVVAAALIAGCSYVPDAINPVEWYKGVAGVFSGSDAPEIASPRRPDGSFPDVNSGPDASGKALPKGLAGDRGNAKYAESVRREPAPTKQLAKRTQPAQTQVAEAPGQAQAAQAQATQAQDGSRCCVPAIIPGLPAWVGQGTGQDATVVRICRPEPGAAISDHMYNSRHGGIPDIKIVDLTVFGRFGLRTQPGVLSLV